MRPVGYMLCIGVVLGIIAMAGVSLSYLHPNTQQGFLFSKQFQYQIPIWKYSLFLHAFSSLILIIAGFFQFVKYIIFKYAKIHKLLGKIYLINVLFLAAPSGLIMAFYASGGWLSKISFIIAALLWFVISSNAYKKIRQKNLKKHVELMLYSYALTLSAVTLRVLTLIANEMRWDATPIFKYTSIAWTSWLLNVLLAFVLIKMGFVNYLLNKKTDVL